MVCVPSTERRNNMNKATVILSKYAEWIEEEEGM